MQSRAQAQAQAQGLQEGCVWGVQVPPLHRQPAMTAMHGGLTSSSSLTSTSASAASASFSSPESSSSMELKDDSMDAALD